MAKSDYQIKQKSYFLREMTWMEVKQLLSKPNTVVIMPTGSTEQHGPHLPIGTDSYIGNELTRRVSKHLRKKIPFIVTPPVFFGASSHHIDCNFPGTMSVNLDTYIRLIVDLCSSLIRQGLQKIFLLNSHGGNHDPLKVAVRTIRDEYKVLIALGSYYEIAGEQITRLRESGPGGAAHAGELETSCMLVIKPELVYQDRFKRQIPKWKSEYLLVDLQRGGSINLAQHFSEFTPTGMVGDATLASKEKGERFLEEIAKALSQAILDFSSWEVGKMTEE
jgi:creatinine amidohydrolase